MNFLLCYRATDGTPVYSEPITGEGFATLRLDKTPSSTNGAQMVFAVIVNTDYQYTGNMGIRKLHYDYKLKLETGVSGAGAANVKYYNDFKLDYKWPEIGEVPAASSSSVAASSSSAEVSSSSSTTSIVMHLGLSENISGPADVFDLQGRYLGTLQPEQLLGKSIAEAVRAKHKNPGAYLVRRGQSIQRINVQ